LANSKRQIERRLDKSDLRGCAEPMLTACNIHYEIGERARGIAAGGLGAMHLLVRRLGLADAIDRRLEVLKIHLPYHESDHVLALAYLPLCGGTCLQDLELLRQANPVPTDLPTTVYAAHLVASATMAALERGADIGRLFQRMLDLLKAKHDTDPIFGPLLVRHPGNITRDLAYVRFSPGTDEVPDARPTGRHKSRVLPGIGARMSLSRGRENRRILMRNGVLLAGPPREAV
jgi:hypothetical protein